MSGRPVEEMEFRSRLLAPVTVKNTLVQYTNELGQNIEGANPMPTTIETDTPLEIWECGCGKHPCAAWQQKTTTGTVAIVTANLPNGASVIRPAN